MAKINYTLYIDASIREKVKRLADKLFMKEHQVIADAIEYYQKGQPWKSHSEEM